MTLEEFEKLVADEFPDAVPEKFREKVSNVAFLAEDEPSPEVRAAEGLGPHETLLGYYRGIPHTARGDWYGVGGTMPDTITLYRMPIEEVAEEELYRRGGQEDDKESFLRSVRKVIRETIWHEVAHHFGMDEEEVRVREARRDSEREE